MEDKNTEPKMLPLYRCVQCSRLFPKDLMRNFGFQPDNLICVLCFTKTKNPTTLKMLDKNHWEKVSKALEIVELQNGISSH